MKLLFVLALAAITYTDARPGELGDSCDTKCKKGANHKTCCNDESYCSKSFGVCLARGSKGVSCTAVKKCLPDLECSKKNKCVSAEKCVAADACKCASQDGCIWKSKQKKCVEGDDGVACLDCPTQTSNKKCCQKNRDCSKKKVCSAVNTCMKKVKKTKKPTRKTKQPTKAKKTKKPTKAKKTKKPTKAEKTKKPTKVKKTKKPTKVKKTDTPTSQPTSSPTVQKTDKPTSQPTSSPTVQKTDMPTSQPTSSPTSQPTSQPTAGPTAAKCVATTCDECFEFRGCLWDSKAMVCGEELVDATGNAMTDQFCGRDCETECPNTVCLARDCDKCTGERGCVWDTKEEMCGIQLVDDMGNPMADQFCGRNCATTCVKCGGSACDDCLDERGCLWDTTQSMCGVLLVDDMGTPLVDAEQFCGDSCSDSCVTARCSERSCQGCSNERGCLWDIRALQCGVEAVDARGNPLDDQFCGRDCRTSC